MLPGCGAEGAASTRNRADAGAARADAGEIADGLVDIYTSDLLAWIADSRNAAIADDAANDGLVTDDATIEQRASVGQLVVLERIACALIDACESEADARETHQIEASA